MLFNSFEFAVFLPVVFLCYWALQRNNPRAQNVWLLAASYVFYGWWDWRFLGLLLLSSVTDFGIGLALEDARPSRRRLIVWTSVAVNLSILGFFKYFGFFIDSAATLLTEAAEEASRLVFGPSPVRFPLEVAAVRCYAEAK